jgi:hypothetical protein
VLATILRTALPLDEALRFEPIEQPRDPRRLLDHPLRHLERGHAILSAAAKDPEHVVLLHRDAMRLDECGHLTPHKISRPHQSEERFLRHALERLPLLQFLLQSAHRQLLYTSLFD